MYGITSLGLDAASVSGYETPADDHGWLGFSLSCAEVFKPLIWTRGIKLDESTPFAAAGVGIAGNDATQWVNIAAVGNHNSSGVGRNVALNSDEIWLGHKQVQPHGWDRIMRNYNEYRPRFAKCRFTFRPIGSTEATSLFRSTSPWVTTNAMRYGGSVDNTDKSWVGDDDHVEWLNNVPVNVISWVGKHPWNAGKSLTPATWRRRIDFERPLHRLPFNRLIRQPRVRWRVLSPWEEQHRKVVVVMKKRLPKKLDRGIDSYGGSGTGTIETAWNPTDQDWLANHAVGGGVTDSYVQQSDHNKALDGWGFFNFVFCTSLDTFGDDSAGEIDDQLGALGGNRLPWCVRVDGSMRFWIDLKSANNISDDYQYEKATVDPDALDDY